MSNQFVFFQTGFFFFQLVSFFFQPVCFFKTVILIGDIKQDHYLGLRTDVTFKTLATDSKWLAFISGKGHCLVQCCKVYSLSFFDRLEFVKKITIMQLEINNTS